MKTQPPTALPRHTIYGLDIRHLKLPKPPVRSSDHLKENSAFKSSDYKAPYLLRRDRDTGAARTTPCLHRQDLIIEVAVAEPVLRPEVEMVGNSHRSRSACALSNGEVLSERARSRDRWLVGPSVGADLVGGSIRGQGTKACG